MLLFRPKSPDTFVQYPDLGHFTYNFYSTIIRSVGLILKHLRARLRSDLYNRLFKLSFFILFLMLALTQEYSINFVKKKKKKIKIKKINK